jgi:predicted dehydrogenase
MSLKAICDPDPQRREQAARDHGVKTFAEMDDMLCEDGIDLVVLVTPNHTHMPLAVKALESGRHVVTEKAMCLTLQEADRMIEASKRHGRLLSVFQSRRWDRDYLTVREVVQGGELGDLFQIDCGVHLFGKPPKGWRRDRNAGGGLLYDWGAHLLDQIVLLAQSEPTDVFAITNRQKTGEADTHARVIVRFEDGLLTETEVSRASWIPRPRWHVWGTRGTLLHQGASFRLRTDKGEREIAYTAPGDPNDYYRNIVAAIQEGESPVVPPEQVRRSIAIIEAALRSDETGASVKLPFHTGESV